MVLRVAGRVWLVALNVWGCAPGGGASGMTVATAQPSDSVSNTTAAPSVTQTSATALPTSPVGPGASAPFQDTANELETSSPSGGDGVSGPSVSAPSRSTDEAGTREQSSASEATVNGESHGAHSDSETSVVASSDEATSASLDDPNRDMTIWLAGDSTVANGSTPCPTGWGKHLGALFNEHTTIRNSAAGGRSVRTWMYNVLTEMGPDGECLLATDERGEPTLQPRWQEMLDNMKAGDALLVQFGINDGSATCDRHVGLEAFKETYGVLVGAAKERGVQPVLITPVSMIKCSGSTPQGSRGAFVDVTLEAGAQLGVPVLDLHARSVERYSELGFCPVAGGDVSASTGGAVGEYFCDDHTHFSASGAADIAALVVELMQKADVSFTSHLK